MHHVDLNCDMGEGCGSDAELMDYVSSANIACGYHAGDAATMKRTVELALEKNVAIGAHPGYRDAENFGRTSMSLTPKEVFDIVVDQVVTLKNVCEEHGAILHHVKPHGALYNQAAKDSELSAAIAEAVASVDDRLILYGLSGSALIAESEAAGLKAASEVFADRTYRADGTLTPRTESNAMITNPEDAVRQVIEMIESGRVVATSGESVAIRADTICVHGDTHGAVDFAAALRRALADRGVAIMPVSNR